VEQSLFVLFGFLYRCFRLLIVFYESFIQDAIEEELPDVISDDGSWHSDNDDSDAEKPPALVAKRPSKAVAGKKSAAIKAPPVAAKSSAPIFQKNVPAASGLDFAIQDGALSVPASVHMPAVPFEAVDDVWIEGVDEDYGDD